MISRPRMRAALAVCAVLFLHAGSARADTPALSFSTDGGFTDGFTVLAIIPALIISDLRYFGERVFLLMSRMIIDLQKMTL